MQATPYVFSRTLDVGGRTDRVVVALDQRTGAKTIPVADIFRDGAVLKDAYSGERATVHAGMVVLTTPFPVVLLEERR